MQIRRFILGTVAIMLALLGAPFVGSASATHVLCGQTITQNTVLDQSVVLCPTDGIVIGADNITLNLNSFTVSGTGPLSQGVGIRIAGHSGVTVTGGTVRQFQAGVSIENGASNTVSALTVADNTGTDGIVISGATSDGNKVLNNLLVRNGQFDGIGVFGGGPGDKVTGTEITGNQVLDSNLSGMTGGIRLENWTWNTTVSNNIVRGSGLEGIATFADTQYTTITGNTVENNGFGTATSKAPRSGDGIRAFARSANHTISNNTVTGNAGNGIFLSGPVTLSTGVVPGVATTTVSNNTATGNNALPTKIIVDLAGFHFEGRAEATVTVLSQTQYVSLPALQIAYDLYDGNATCGSNTWSGNVYGTAKPSCTTL